MAGGDAGHRPQGAPAPRAQLRFTDTDGLRLTAFITNTRGRQLADLELRHRRRARCEDRIRIGKDTRLTNLPLHGFAPNQLWLAVVCLAVELTAWLQMLAFTDHPARRWEPNGFGCACSRSPVASSATPEDADSGSRRTPPGDTSSRPPSPA